MLERTHSSSARTVLQRRVLTLWERIPHCSQTTLRRSETTLRQLTCKVLGCACLLQPYTSFGATRAAALLEGMELLETVEESLGMRGAGRGIAQARDQQQPSRGGRGWGAVRAEVAPPPQSHRSRQLDVARMLLDSVETSLDNDRAGSLSARGAAPAPLPPIAETSYSWRIGTEARLAAHELSIV